MKKIGAKDLKIDGNKSENDNQKNMELQMCISRTQSDERNTK